MKITGIVLSESVGMDRDQGKISALNLIPDLIVLLHEPSLEAPVTMSFNAIVIGLLGPEEEPRETHVVINAPGLAQPIAQGLTDEYLHKPTRIFANEIDVRPVIANMDLRNFPFVSLGEYTIIVQDHDRTKLFEKKFTVTMVKKDA